MIFPSPCSVILILIFFVCFFFTYNVHRQPTLIVCVPPAFSNWHCSYCCQTGRLCSARLWFVYLWWWKAKQSHLDVMRQAKSCFCWIDITSALSGPVTIATGTHRTESVPFFIYLFTLESCQSLILYVHCNILFNWHSRENKYRGSSYPL